MNVRWKCTHRKAWVTVGVKVRFMVKSWACRLIVAAALAISSVPASADGVSGANKPLRILALGDSLTAGFGLPAEDAFPAQLQRNLKAAGIDAVVLNAGVSGDTTAGGRARLGWALADKPDAMIVALGANDGLRGLEPAATEANLDAVLSAAKQAGVPVLLSGMKAPPNLGAEYGTEFDGLFPRLAEKHGVLFDRFFLEGVVARPEFNQEDGIHPNARGVAKIVERLMPMVRRLALRAAKSL